jgi:hypothetical protein
MDAFMFKPISRYSEGRFHPAVFIADHPRPGRIIPYDIDMDHPDEVFRQASCTIDLHTDAKHRSEAAIIKSNFHPKKDERRGQP